MYSVSGRKRIPYYMPIFSDMPTNVAYKCQTGVTLVQGIVTVCVVYLLSLALL